MPESEHRRTDSRDGTEGEGPPGREVSTRLDDCGVITVEDWALISQLHHSASRNLPFRLLIS